MSTTPTPTPPLKGRGFDKGQRRETPPLQGRGKGWGLSVEQLAKLHRRAAEMRRNPTEPEKRLWRHLSNGQLGGHKFRRQSVIGWFIADFLCPQRALIVEVDGDTHDEAKDRLRDDELGRRGFRVVRVTNDDVMTNMDGVLTLIAAALAAAPGRWNKPHPNPFPEGEGLEQAQSPPSPGEGPGVGPVDGEAQKLLRVSLERSEA
jgi:very-short-patch-repair endonuclease